MARSATVCGHKENPAELIPGGASLGYAFGASALSFRSVQTIRPDMAT